MRVCVCGAQQKAQGRGEKATKDDKAKEMAESGQRACLALPCLKPPSPCLAWQMWNLWRAGQTHSTARTDVPSWQVMLARPLYILPLPYHLSPSSAAHAYRWLPSAVYVYVGRSLASFLYAIEHTLMLYDVVMLVKMLVHTHTHTRSSMCVCVCVSCRMPHRTVCREKVGG